SKKGDPPKHQEELERRRVRTLTEKGTNIYEVNRNKLFEKVEHVWTHIENLIIDNDKCELSDIRKLEVEIKTKFHEFVLNNNDYTDFLSRENTTASNEDLIKNTTYFLKCKKIIDTFLEKLRSQKLDIIEVASASYSSRVSVASKKRVEAEVHQSKLLFKKKEAEVLRKKAMIKEELDRTVARTLRQNTELEVDLDIIKLESEHAVAIKELQALEDTCNYNEDGFSVVDRKEFTERYIDELQETSTMRTPSPLKHQHFQPTPKVDLHQYSVSIDKHSVNNTGVYTHMNKVEPPHPQQILTSDNITQPNCYKQYSSMLNPNATPFNEKDNKIIHGLSQFLLKKDLQLSRLTHFDDKPETFLSWKASFNNIASSLELSHHEEIDLLVKYLGPESRKFANR
ncbi:uncharacterized protein LOC132721944, partial [Ruditapes philippinarum]|uniref:uncharacterized protein LOC132721944 n=1 Tax=Ruditapes philippinarum TaxID=129788 RepID=UPI00295A93EA